jgi:cytochrome c peroxidase
MKKIIVLYLTSLLLFAIACSKTEEEVNRLLLLEIPTKFPKPLYNFENNQLTEQGFELGKKLFYDAGLSIDGSISCGSCHQQFAGFANLDHDVSHGVDNCFGKRNAPVLFNMIWKDDFFADGGAKHLEISPLNAMIEPCEMANDINNILAYLKNKPEYQKQFKRAFSTDVITSQNMLRALTQFMGSLISTESKYDDVKAGKATFTLEEEKGYQLFLQKCASCHTEPLFTDNSFRNNGLDVISKDLGRALITTITTDEAKFKVPTLRNIEVSRPYMHDGRFKTLEQVLNHYQNGIKNHANLDAILKQGSTLSNQDKLELITFLKTLTDNNFLKNPKFSEN